MYILCKIGVAENASWKMMERFIRFEDVVGYVIMMNSEWQAVDEVAGSEDSLRPKNVYGHWNGA